jgi:hypothetical protein
MLFQRINRSDPEKVFIVVYNSYGTAALANGYAVQWDFTTDVNGVGVTIPTAITTNQGFAAAGIAAEAIAAGAYGLIQVYGYHGSVHFRAGTGLNDGALGQPIAMNAAGSVWCLETYLSDTTTAKTVVFPCAFLMSAYSSWTSSTVKAFIKCL